MAIEDIINHVTNQDFSKAAPTFAEIMGIKVNDALEQEKIAVADQVFNQATDPASEEEIVQADSEVEEDEDSLDDEEVQDALADEIEADDVEDVADVGEN